MKGLKVSYITPQTGTDAVFTRSGKRSTLSKVWVAERVEFETPQSGIHSTETSKTIPNTLDIFFWTRVKHCCMAYMRRNMNENPLFKVLRYVIIVRQDIHLLRICCFLYSSQSSAASKLPSPRTPIGEVRGRGSHCPQRDSKWCWRPILQWLLFSRLFLFSHIVHIVQSWAIFP